MDKRRGQSRGDVGKGGDDGNKRPKRSASSFFFRLTKEKY